MKKIVVYESITADSEWTKFHWCATPHPGDVCLADEMNATETRRYIVGGIKEVRDLVSEMPLEAPKWKHSGISEYVTWGSEGRRDWRIRVKLTLEDLGRCVVGQIVMNGELRSVLIMFPGQRKNVVVENLLTQISALVPEHVRERVAAKIEADCLTARGDVALCFMPRKICKPEVPGISDFERLLMRAGFQWANWRDMASEAFANSKVA